MEIKFLDMIVSVCHIHDCLLTPLLTYSDTYLFN